jgi:O-antigen/teichoic acid export membrane protein
MENIQKDETSFTKDVFTLVSGTTVSQIITVASVPFLTRIYTAKDFGLLAIFISITTIGTVISSLRYELAIVLPESREEGRDLFIGVLIVTAFTSMVLGLVLWFFRFSIINFLHAQEIAELFWLLPISIFFSGCFQAFSYWLTREKKFFDQSLSKLINVFIVLLTQILLGVFGFATAGGLVIAVILGNVISFLFLLLKQVIKGELTFRSVNLIGITQLLYRYRKFPIYDSWAALMNSISWQLPTFLLSFYFSSVQVGYYSIGNRLLRLPMNLIGTSIGQVFFQRAAEQNMKGQLCELVMKTYRELVNVGFFPMLLLSIVGQDLFVLFLGKDWGEAGIYTQILSIWMFFWFISSPLSIIFRVIEKQEFSLVINLFILITRFLSLYIGGLSGSVYIALGLFAISGILLYGFLSFAVVVSAGVKIQFIIQTLLRKIFLFIPFGLVVIVLKYVGEVSSFILISFSIISLFVYYLFEYRSVIQNMILKDKQPSVH